MLFRCDKRNQFQSVKYFLFKINSFSLLMIVDEPHEPYLLTMLSNWMKTINPKIIIDFVYMIKILADII